MVAIFYKLFLVLSLAISALSQSCNISDNEYAALFSLYNSTLGGNWYWDESLPQTTIWNFPSPLDSPCSNNWQRLQCKDIGNGDCQVIALSLYGFGLEGSLPSEIGLLTNLVELNVTSNLLRSNIPVELSACLSLQTLALDINSFSGPIPLEIGALTSLSVLYLNNNSLTGSITSTIGELTGLVALRLNSNRLQGTLPKELSHLSSLELLTLFVNFFTGGVSDEILQGWSTMKVLNMQANLFSGSIPNYYLIPNLLELYFDYNLFTGSIPNSFCSLTTVSSIIMRDNKIDGTIPRCISNLTSLQFLDLHSNFLSQSLPTEIGLVSSLISLSFGTNNLYESIPSELVLLTNLKSFNSESNGIHTTLPSFFWDMLQLSQLVLSDNSFTGTIPPSVGNMSNLDILQIDTNQLKGTLPTEISKIGGLREFYVQVNELHGSLPTEYGLLGKLEQFEVSFNSLSGTIPSEYGNMTALNVLLIEKMKLTGTIPSSLCKLNLLQTFNLNSNSLSGTLPECMGNMTSMVNIQFCCCNISGSIPAGLTNMHNLETLYLSYNSIDGPIPSNISAWSQLVELYLENTMLSGTIPEGLAKLKSLGVLDLSETLLTGTIPTLGFMSELQFLNLSFTLLDGKIPESLALLPRVKVLSLQNNYYTGKLPGDVGLNEGLEYFSVGFNYLTGTVPDDIVVAKTLGEFDVGHNFLNGSVPFRFGMSQSLIYIVASNNLFTGTLPSNWSEFKNLQYVYVDGNYLTGSIPYFPLSPDSRYAAVSLIQFYASNNQLQGTLPTALLTHTDLTVLSLGQNKLRGTIPSQLINLRKLENLDLSTNIFEGNINPAFAKPFPNLTFVNLANNSFSNNLPSAMFESSVLQVVTLNSNCFSGSIPETICYSSVLTSIIMDSLSSGSSCAISLPKNMGKVIKGVFPKTKLDGTIPACIFESPKLAVLQLAGNGLKGPIADVPLSKVLTNLELGYNALTGTIPAQFQQRGGFNVLSLQHNKLTGVLRSDFNVSSDSMTLNLDVNRLSGNLPGSLGNIDTISVITGNLFECVGVSDLPVNDPSRYTYVCGSSQLNTALYVWLSLIAALLLFASFIYLVMRYSKTSIHESTMKADPENPLNIELRPSAIASSTPFDRTTSVDRRFSTNSLLSIDQLNRSAIERIERISLAIHQTSRWIGFDYSSRRNLLANTAQFSSVLSRAGNGLLSISLTYMLCMLTYIILKSSSYGLEYSTISQQYGWIITASFLHGYLPTFLLMAFVAVTSFSVIASLNIDSLLSSANKRSIQRERWRDIKRYSRSNAICSRIYDVILRPFCAHVVNFIITLTANSIYVSVLLKIQPEEVFFVQASMSLFKIGWVNCFIPFAIQQMRYLPATSQFRHEVAMLLISYIIGPGIATAGANSNCFYPAIVGSSTISSTFSVFNTILSCNTQFSFIRTNFGVDVSYSSMTCSFLTSVSTAISSTTPPFIYGYQCGSAFLVDYIPVLFYSYLFSAVMLPIWRSFILLSERATVKRYLGEKVYAFLIQDSLMDCDIGVSTNTALSQSNSVISDITVNDLLVTESNSKSDDLPTNKLSSSPSFASEKRQSITEKPLFDGSLVVAKRILDFAVTLTFGLACPLLALAIGLSVYMNSLSWKMMIGKFLSSVGENDNSAFSRLELSCEGLLRGALGGMWIAVCAISLFWSVIFYDMIADQYGHLTGIAFALCTIFCLPVCLYLVFVVRGYVIEHRSKRKEEQESEVRGGIRSQMSVGVDLFSSEKAADPAAEQNSEFL